MLFLLQAEVPSLINETVLNSDTFSVKTVLIALVSYVVCASIQYFLSLLLKKRDVRNERQMKIADLTLQKELELFEKLDHLRTFQKEENHQLLDEIVGIKDLLAHNRLMYRKQLYKTADETIDYFSKLCTDYSKRDPNKELKLLDKYRDQFYEK